MIYMVILNIKDMYSNKINKTKTPVNINESQSAFYKLIIHLDQLFSRHLLCVLDIHHTLYHSFQVWIN